MKPAAATASTKNHRSTLTSASMVASVRARVIRTLLAVLEGQSLASVLDPLLNSLHDGDKGFAHALLLTTLRHWYALERLLDSLADKPIDEITVRTTINVGMVQLLYLEVADHAAIHETVEAAKQLDSAHASGLINAILRKIAKNPNKYRKKCDKNHSLPNWLAHQLKQDWREQYGPLTQGLRQPAPMFLRVNPAHTTFAEYRQQLQDAEIAAQPVTLVSTLQLPDQTLMQVETSALRLERSMAVSYLPAFLDGALSIQDSHAQLAAPLIHHALLSRVVAENRLPHDIAITDRDPDKSIDNDDASSIHLLDACAAPGGKLAQWLELLTNDASLSKFHVKPKDDRRIDTAFVDTRLSTRQVSMTAIDDDGARIDRIHDNLQRLQLQQTAAQGVTLDILCADATRWQQCPASDLGVFDAILLDAPCSATGVIRRHPDISILRQEEDIEQTARVQARILDNLWPQLKSGGHLLYVTCSILKRENVSQMQQFLSKHQDAVAIALTDDCNWGLPQDIGRQCLPIDSEGGDGFYYALLRKQ